MSSGGAAAIWPTQQVIHVVVDGSAGGLASKPPTVWRREWLVIQDAAAQGLLIIGASADPTCSWMP